MIVAILGTIAGGALLSLPTGGAAGVGAGLLVSGELVLATHGVATVGASWVALSKDAASLAKLLESPSSGGSGNYNKLDPKQIEKKYGLEKGQFHREVKEDLLKEAKELYPNEIKKLGNNPDILLDSNGNVQFKSTNGSGKTFIPNFNINDFLP